VVRRASKPKAVDAKERAAELLASRDRTVRELMQRLAREGFPDDEAKQAVEAMRRLGALDDEGTAGRYARSKLRNAAIGTRRIRATLTARGVAKPAVEAGLAEALDEVPEEDALDALVRRRWPHQAGSSTEERLRRMAAFLLRRGFPAALVASRLTKLAPGAAEVLEGIEDVEDEQ
jgi:regulatory protein